MVIDNYPQDQVEELDAVNNPEDAAAGTRKLPFSRVLYIDRDDFREDPPRKYFRLAPGREVRLRYAYFIKCVDLVRDPQTGEVVELRCTYDPETRGGYAPDGRKVRGTIHWVSGAHAIEAEVRLYDHLFSKENPDDLAAGEDYKDHLNPASREVLARCRLEPGLAGAPAGNRYQFERSGVLLRRPRFGRRRARVQPHRRTARHLGPYPEEKRIRRLTPADRRHERPLGSGGWPDAGGPPPRRHLPQV